MSQPNHKPYVATATATDSLELFAKLERVKATLETAQKEWWVEFESPFEIFLNYKNFDKKPTTGQLIMGRFFWEDAEIRFRCDGSRLTKPYQLVLVADQPQFQNDFEEYLDTYPSSEWDEPTNFKRVLWGAPLKIKIEARSKEVQAKPAQS